MELKIMFQVVSNSEILARLSPQEMYQFASVFCLPSEKNISCEMVMQALKKNISFLLLLERQQYKSYLSLPKFNQLSKSSLLIIYKLFQNTWVQFLNILTYSQQFVQNLFQPRYNFVPNQIIYPERPIFNPYIYKEVSKDQQDIKIQEKQSSKNNSMEFQEKINFCQCACSLSMNQTQSQNFFSCQNCHSYLHLQCLNLKQAKKLCPKCQLTQQWIFRRFVRNLLKYGWLKWDKNPIEINFTDNQIFVIREQLKILEQNKQFQLRFISIKKQKQKINVNIANKRFMIILNQEQIHHILKLKRITLSLKNQTQEQLLYFVLTCSQKRTYESIKNQLLQSQKNSNFFSHKHQNASYMQKKNFQSNQISAQFQGLSVQNKQILSISSSDVLDTNYLNNYFQTNTQPYIEISLIDPISKFLINIPVQSEQCQHMELFDLRAFFQETNKNKYQCPLCQIAISPRNSIRVDNFMYSVFQAIAALTTLSKDQEPPTDLCYYRNGDVATLRKGDQSTEIVERFMAADFQAFIKNQEKRQKQL